VEEYGLNILHFSLSKLQAAAIGSRIRPNTYQSADFQALRMQFKRASGWPKRSPSPTAAVLLNLPRRRMRCNPFGLPENKLCGQTSPFDLRVPRSGLQMLLYLCLGWLN
jgi:hypothetical protein